MIVKENKKGVIIEVEEYSKNSCRYCHGVLEDKKLYEKGFEMKYCKECDVFFAK